jgi:hypothetical protein
MADVEQIEALKECGLQAEFRGLARAILSVDYPADLGELTEALGSFTNRYRKSSAQVAGIASGMTVVMRQGVFAVGIAVLRATISTPERWEAHTAAIGVALGVWALRNRASKAVVVQPRSIWCKTRKSV